MEDVQKLVSESTIIDLTNKPKILRLGGIEIEKISDTINLSLTYNTKKKINILVKANFIILQEFQLK